MTHPFMRAAAIASIAGGIVLAAAAPATASEDEPGWPFEYEQCYDVIVELPDRTPTVTACSPV